MMMRARLFPMLTLVCVGACGGPELSGDEVNIAIARQALLADNALSQNALSQNALSQNALSQNALSQNALSQNALSQNALAALQDPGSTGALNRELMRYIVSCSLDSSQSFSFSWTDSNKVRHDECYQGDIGLATSWAAGPLSTSGQEWVTACLAARVNWYQKTVTISMRGGRSALDTSFQEENMYDREEGAFWGNIFNSSPHVYSCYNGNNINHSRSLYRDCASGHLNTTTGTVSDCGIIEVLGNCNSRCSSLSQWHPYHESCSIPDGMSTSRVITTFLP